ncbi:MAG: hypothetical protein R2757_13885 [Draconibacterium sp.]
MEKRILIWNDNDLLGEVKIYNEKGDLNERIIYEYNKNDKLLNFSNKRRRTFYEYDDKRLISDSTIYLENFGNVKKGDTRLIKYNYYKKNAKTFCDVKRKDRGFNVVKMDV